MFEIGRICLKTTGREAGRYCVVLQKPAGRHVLVTGPRELTGVKRRKCNLAHLEPVLDHLDIPAEASDADVRKAWEGHREKLRILAAKKERA